MNVHTALLGQDGAQHPDCPGWEYKGGGKGSLGEHDRLEIRL